MKLIEQKRVAKVFYAAMGAIIFTLAGCQNSSSIQATPTPPMSETIYNNTSTLTTAKFGTSYCFNLFTHCGVEFLRFDGNVWKVDIPLGDAARNPPTDWPSPVAPGVVTLLNASQLTFTLPGKTRVQFHVTSENLPLCD